MTPGQLAYEAYAAGVLHRTLPWEDLTDREREAWEAAAHAVILAHLGAHGSGAV